MVCLAIKSKFAEPLSIHPHPQHYPTPPLILPTTKLVHDKKSGFTLFAQAIMLSHTVSFLLPNSSSEYVTALIGELDGDILFDLCLFITGLEDGPEDISIIY